jgi:hypothetical protein
VAGAALCVAFLDAKILYAQPADGRGHPAILVTMIVNAAALADLPANGHALEDAVLENQVARVVSLGEEKILFQRLRTRRMVQNIILHGFEREVAFANGRQASNPVIDDQLLRRDFHLFVHFVSLKVSKLGLSLKL